MSTIGNPSKMKPNTDLHLHKQLSASSMSNRGMRDRRTVPLDDDDDGDQSIPEENSLISSAQSATTSSSNRSHSHSRRRRRKDDSSGSRRKSNGSRRSKSGSSSSHSRASISSTPSISIDELKKSLKLKTSTSRNGSSSNFKTPSHSSNRLTIGNSNSSQALLSALPDLFGLEQALQDLGEEELKEGIERLMMQQEEEEEEEGVQETRRDSLSKTPVAWKTPFEVDAPRLAPTIPRSPSPERSLASDPDQLLSEEQYAWAGIDELLECKSLDDSYTFSTSEILPRDTVKAMRRDFSLGFLEEEQPQEESVGGGSRTSKRSSESISRNSSNSSQSSRMKGNAASKSKTSSGHDSDAPSLVDSSDHEEADDQLAELMSVIRRKQQGRVVVPDHRESGAGNNSGNLFDMFHWSEKDNVDELRSKNTKLNRKPGKVTLLTNAMRKSSHASRSSHKSNHGSDTCSLPSLASFQDDDFSAVSSVVDWESFHPKETSSIVSDSSKEEFGGDEEYDDGDDDCNTEDFENSTSLSLVGDGLVLDKTVDEYIRMIQKQLPTIVESNANAASTKRDDEYVDETSPSPTSVAEESAFDELPTYASLSHSAHVRSSEKAQGKQGPRKMEEKKEPKPSLSFQLMSSIKKMTITGKPSKKKSVGGDDEKYFPEAVEPEKAKVFKENRCLLGEGDDGENWE